MTTSQSSPPRGGREVAERGVAGAGASAAWRRRPRATPQRHLVADRLAHARVVAVAEPGEDLQEQQQVLVPPGGEASILREEVLARLEARAPEAPRERQPVEHEQREPDAAQRGRAGSPET